MIAFAEIIKDRIENNFAKYQVDIGFLEDYIPGRLPGVLITPVSQRKNLKSLNGAGKNVGLVIRVFDQHNPNSSILEIENCNEIINLLEKDSQIIAKYINLTTDLRFEIDKQEGEIDGLFIGTISVIADLRR